MAIDGSRRPRRNGQRGEHRRRFYAAFRQYRFALRLGYISPAKNPLDVLRTVLYN